MKYILYIITFLYSFTFLNAVTVYHSVDFNTGIMPSDMTIVDNDGLTPYYTFMKAAWQPYIDPNFSSYVAVSSSRYNPPGQSDDWMITPAINIGDNTVLEWEAFAFESGRADGYEVRLSTEGTDISTFTKVLFSIPAELTSWQKRFVNLKEQGYSNQKVYIAFRNNSNNKNALFVDNIKVFTPDSYDLTTTNINISKWYPIQDAPINITGTIFNYGTVTINSFDLNYSDNEEDPVIIKLSDLNIPMMTAYNFSFNWTPTTLDKHTLKVWGTNINGQNDQNNANDKMTVSTFIYDKNKARQRKPCLEVFTSSTCGPCRYGNANVQSIIANNQGKYTKINYQMNWPGNGDPYYTAEGGARRTYYGINAVPWMQIDGGWNQNSQVFTQQILDSYSSVPSFVTIDATYNITGETVTVNAKVTPTMDFTSEMRLYVAVIENTTYKNKANNGETEFHDVMKKMLPSSNGTRITSLTADVPFDVDLSYTFKNSGSDAAFYTVEEFSDLSVVLFLQNYSTKEILQSERATFVSTPVYDNKHNDCGIASISPCPADNIAQIKYKLPLSSFAKLEIFDLFGNLVYLRNLSSNQSELATELVNVEFLSNGIYSVRLTAGSNSYTQRLVIQR